MGQRALDALDTTNDINSLQQILQVHGFTKAAPFIRFKLGNAYFDDAKYPEARKEYEYLITHYPNHETGKMAKLRLEVLAVNETWQKTELDKQVRELIAKRGLPNLTIKTTKGDFEVELFEDEAPNTTAHFIQLAEKGFYNQTPFLEVSPDLGLCLDEKDTDHPYHLRFEKNNLKHEEGSLGMLRVIDPNAKDIPERLRYLNSACTRFYVFLKPEAPELDGRYTIFGRVTRGMDVVRQITQGIQITQIIVNYKRPHPYEPQTIKTVRTLTPTDTTPITTTPPAPPK